jgi:predicted CopG family antitoxin
MQIKHFTYIITKDTMKTISTMKEVYFKLHKPTTQNKAIFNGLIGEYIAFTFLKDKFKGKVYLRHNFWQYFATYPTPTGERITGELDTRLSFLKDLCIPLKYLSKLPPIKKISKFISARSTTDLLIIKNTKKYLIEVKYGYDPKFSILQLKYWEKVKKRGFTQLIIHIKPTSKENKVELDLIQP